MKLNNKTLLLIDTMSLCSQTLCKAQRTKMRGGREVIYFLEPSGVIVSSGVALKAIESGYLKPNNDGLFGEAYSQTWRFFDKKI